MQVVTVISENDGIQWFRLKLVGVGFFGQLLNYVKLDFFFLLLVTKK